MKIKPIGMDTETEFVDFKRTESRLAAKIEGLSVSWDGNGAAYFTDREDWRNAMREVNAERMTTIWHNFKFDTQVLENASLPQPKLWEDTKIASQVLDENFSNGLKDLAKKYLGVKDPMVFDEADKKKLLDFEVFAEYAKNDARYDYRLWEIFAPKLVEEELLPIYNLEKRMVHASLEIERNGIRVDAKKLAKMAVKVNRATEKLLWKIYGYAGKQFNTRSPAQLSEILFNDLGLPPGKRSKKTGRYSTDAETLQDLKERHAIVEHLMEYRGLDKLATGFLNSLSKFIGEGDRIHPTLNSLTAVTGRTSSSAPNLQNIPVRTELGKELRSGFIPRPGYKFIIADYSQMELRILGEMVYMLTDDRTLFDILANGEDLHIRTAEAMFKKRVGKDDVERKVAKWINFGIVYGITPIGLSNRLKKEGIIFSERECEQLINIYFNTYPGIREYMGIIEDLAHRTGYVRNAYGRKRRVRGSSSRQKRQATNYTIQGTGADAIKSAMVALYDIFVGTEVLCVGMIHDELIFEVPERLAKRTRETILEAMTVTPPKFLLPLPVDATIGSSWAEKG